MEPLSFLALGGWEVGDRTFEIASRPKLDSRQVLPWFEEDGVVHAGLLERARPSRVARGAPARGLEAIGFDFGGVDESGDIRDYGRAIFSARARVAIDERALPVALPSWARSIGYLSELTLPLLLRVAPPAERAFDVEWDGGRHRIVFQPVAELRARLLGVEPRGEELETLLDVLAPPPPRPALAETPGAAALLGRTRLLDAAGLAAALAEPAHAAFRRRDLAPDELRFLAIKTIEQDGRRFEVVTPASGVSVALLPYVVAGGVPHLLLSRELRAAALERRARQPIYDLPVPLRYANALGFFIGPDEEVQLARDPATACAALLARALGAPAGVRGCAPLGVPAEPAVSISTEVRHRLACELDPAALPPLPEGAFFIAAPELARAVADGLVRDPVIAGGLAGGRFGVDPYARARTGEPARRRAFIDRMTSGSVVQRRLKGYSSIEAEQLRSPTYARLMTLLQHEFGLRIVYPRAEKDRSFFKAAYRVFMAADRGEDRALQGLHFSHDCFHFALGNFTPPALPDFERWYASGAPPPPDPRPEGPDWERYARALKHAENEATFFSFWTLYAEHLPLARHVGKLTFYEAVRDLGLATRAEVFPLYLELCHEARLPAALAAARGAAAELFEYMRGFRDHHYKDIAVAWRYAVKEPYRSYTIRFGIYEHDLDRYLDGVHGFSARLAAYPPGLNPLLCACADVKVDLALRVWDLMKALKLMREPAGSAEARAGLLARAEETFASLLSCKEEVARLRAAVQDAEMSARNEALHEQIAALAARVERLREGWWDAVAATRLLPEAVVAEERARELPR